MHCKSCKSSRTLTPKISKNTCRVCYANFSSKPQLSRHENYCIKIDPLNLVPPEKNYYFSKAFTLHLNILSDETMYDVLLSHLRLLKNFDVTNSKPEHTAFTCGGCLGQFSNFLHLAAHTQDFNHECGLLSPNEAKSLISGEKVFTSTAKLINHVKSLQ